MTGETTIYHTEDVRRILNCGRDKAYSLMRSRGFPATRIGKTYIITKEHFDDWLDKYAGKHFRT